MVETFDLKTIYNNHPLFNQILEFFVSNDKLLHIEGLAGSSSSLLSGSLFRSLKKNFLIILPDKESAAYFHNDIANIFGEKHLLFFPSSYKRSVQHDVTDKSSIVLRTEVLNKLAQKNNYFITVTYSDALLEKIHTKKELENNTIEMKTGENFSMSFIIEVLVDAGFIRNEFVMEPGEFAIRGGILDVFSFSNDFPFRIDFFGDEIESIRSFEVDTQLSRDKLKKIDIVPNMHQKQIEHPLISFFDFINPGTILWIADTKFTLSHIDELFNAAKEPVSDLENAPRFSSPEEFLINGNDFLLKVENLKIIEFGQNRYFSPAQKFSFNTTQQPAFNKNFDLLIKTLKQNVEEGYKNHILSHSDKQIQRLLDIFRDKEEKISFSSSLTVVHQGFIDRDLMTNVFTDHQIFERYHRFAIRSNFSKKECFTLSEITNLNPGDYVVHIDHGIGKFGGLEKMEINGKKQEAIRLVYRDNDILYVSIHSLHRISKYRGSDGEPPKIYKLGTGAWQKIKERTKNKVKDIARDLIVLYAKRKQEKGFVFSPDSYLQQELEASFIYEDTPDQYSATVAVKTDMESDLPMDRLICGDVGFGKTEVAIRAAFKAVADSKQVAVLVPTTILALQHFQTFSERLKDLPCNVEYISRLRSPQKQKEVLKKLEDGKIDVIIGTHKIVGNEIKFNDLGLLIIDEEQKFGVAIKEKLKQKKINVDTLTLTATPIPRTLQFSLMGARDLSNITTPPPNRHPIITELHTFNEAIIKEAIDYETSRNGQVFFINNRIENILEVQGMINRICPEARTVVGHGRMEGAHLESVMLNFIRGDYDVLIATTIIENGLDIPNANTIIINNANNFGLSDLHQLRGRVGRSNKKAFCYLLAPPVTQLTPEARRRLRAIEEFSELGSGFSIALQDLDIRGAGNMLGAEQSGFIADIGYETYQKILNEAVQELHEEEFKELFANRDEEKSRNVTGKIHSNDCQVESDLELLFPDNYIESTTERIKLYRQLDNIKQENLLQEFSDNLKDRFGNLPSQAVDLLDVVRLRWLAQKLGIEKLVLKSNKMICYFISNKESAFYQSETFLSILNYLQYHPGFCQMKEQKEKLSIVFDTINHIASAIEKLNRLFPENDKILGNEIGVVLDSNSIF